MTGPLKIVKVEVNTRTRKLAENWTCKILPDIESYVDADTLTEMTKMLEWNIQAEQLKAMSWLEFKVDKNKCPTYLWEEMHKWAKEHCSGEYKVRQGTWMFKNEKDYIVFKLRWS